MTLNPPEPKPQPDWTPLAEGLSPWQGSSFVSADIQPGRLRVKYYIRETDCRLFARVWFGPGAVGQPGFVHGGAECAVLDESMGVACLLRGLNVISVSITVGFRRPIPVGIDTVVEAWVESLEGTRVATEAKIMDGPQGHTYADARGIFRNVPIEPLIG